MVIQGSLSNGADHHIGESRDAGGGQYAAAQHLPYPTRLADEFFVSADH
jgi:hypothetical protein